MARKLYCFVDETGQDTQGELFLVAVVVENRDRLVGLEKKLLEIEAASGKRADKWRRSGYLARFAYLSRLRGLPNLRGSVYYALFRNSKSYVPLTALSIAKAVQAKTFRDRNYAVKVIIDGLNDKDRDIIRKELKKLGIRYKKIRGMKDEQSAFLRLADAMAGLLRDYHEGQAYARALARQLKDKRILVEI